MALYAAGIGTKNQTDIRRIEPQVTQIVRATAACKAGALKNPARRRACAKRIRIGLSACRQDLDCRVAFLALINAAEREEVVPGGNSHSGLEPGPGATPGPENPTGPPSPSPGSGPTQPHPTPAAPPAGPPNPSPGNGPPTGKSVVTEVEGTANDAVDHAQDAVGDVAGKACSATGSLNLC